MHDPDAYVNHHDRNFLFCFVISSTHAHRLQIDTLTYKDFIDKELVLFSRADCERSIPSVVDGLKPGKPQSCVSYWHV
jgi:hypothetical protein